jgi:hypothetical protein
MKGVNDLHSSPNTIQVIKSGRMIWARCMAQMGESYRIRWGNVTKIDAFVNLGVNGRKISL